MKGLQESSKAAMAVALLAARAQRTAYGRHSKGSVPAMRATELAKELGVKTQDLGSLLRVAVRDGHILTCDVQDLSGRRTIEYRAGSGLPNTWQPLKGRPLRPAYPGGAGMMSLFAAPMPDAQPAVALNTGSVPSVLPPSSPEGHAVDEIPSAALDSAADGVDVVDEEILDLERDDEAEEEAIRRIELKIINPPAGEQQGPNGFRCAIYDDGELVLEVGGEIVRLTRNHTFRLCTYLEPYLKSLFNAQEVPG